MKKLTGQIGTSAAQEEDVNLLSLIRNDVPSKALQKKATGKNSPLLEYGSSLRASRGGQGLQQKLLEAV